MAKKRPNKKNKITKPQTPVTAEGSLDWRRVSLPRLAQDKQLRGLPQATLADQEVPTLAGLLIAVALGGIVFTTKFSPLLLALLVLVSLIDRRMRDNNWMLLQALLASVMCLACWPLIGEIVVSTSHSLTTLALVTLAAFTGALWLVGNVTRAASLLYDRPFTRTGLYAAGVACQSLSLLVLLLGVIQLGTYVTSL